MTGVNPDLSILIPAAGMGFRFGQGPKALLEIDGKPLLQWLVAKAQRIASEVIVAAPPGQLEHFRALCPDCLCIAGGSTRQDSVAALVRAANREWLLIQDIARPFASTTLMQAVAHAAKTTGCAGAFSDPEVPVAQIRDGRVVATIARDQAGIFQAPQCFSSTLLRNVLQQTDHNGWLEQSTLQLALRAGADVVAVPGEKTNIKLTTPHDWQLAQQFKDLLR